MLPLPRPKPRLAVVFVQYDRRKYSLALEKLIALLARLRAVDFRVLVVDNANPGHWYHDVSDKLTQIGGDNSAWEFSAFDRGIAFLAESGETADLYAFATDAFLAYGEDYLDLIDDTTIEACLTLGAVIGWVDSFGQELDLLGQAYRDWVRTSLFFLPPHVLSTLSPLTTPFDAETIFSADFAAPFHPTAPLSHNLQQLLLAWLTRDATSGVELAEVWHSQIDLNARSYPFFKAKASAILREHLLSARLQAAEIPCYDFRLIHRLPASGRPVAEIEADDWSSWCWSAGIEAPVAKVARYNIESFDVPRAIVHGMPSLLKASGWVATSPQVRECAIRFSGGPILGARCDIPRPDVQASRPEIDDPICGFEIEASLDCLVPGSYVAEWYVPGTELLQEVGTVFVADRFEFEPQRLFLPAAAYPGQKLPVAAEGMLSCSQPLHRVSVRWDDDDTDLVPVAVAAPTDPNGLHLYRISFTGEIPYRRRLPQHTLEIRFESADSLVSTWRHFHILRHETVLPHLVSRRSLSDFDSQTGAVEIHLKGAVLADGAEDDVVLMRDDRVLAAGQLEAAGDARRSIRWFEIQSTSFEIAPGLWDFALALRRPGHAPPEVFSRWQDRIGHLQPKIHAEDFEVHLQEGRQASYLLRISGWVENHSLTDHVDVTVDGDSVATLALDEFRRDVAEHFGQPLIQRQGFRDEIRLAVEPGEHTVQLVAVHDDRPAGRWQGRLAFPAPFSAAFLIESEVLDNLAQAADHVFWGAIAIRGTAFTDLPETWARLYVDGKLAGEQPVTDGDPFEISHVPERSGIYRVRALFATGDRTLYDSGSRRAEFVGIAVPEELEGALDRFIDRFELRSWLGPEASTAQLAHRLLEHRGDAFPELLDLWRQMAGTLEAESQDRDPPPVIQASDLEPDSSRGDERLKVLFVSWEVPCSRHGGGVWMINILQLLAQRHDITVVHSYGQGEERWADELRPLVDRVISIPRRSGTYQGDTKIPEYCYRDFCTELRSVVETELLAQRYDIVDYEYSRMFTHMATADTPRVLTVFEDGFTAKLLACARAAASSARKIDHLHDLFEEFYFRATAMPRAFRHLIAVTEEDAQALSSFVAPTRIFINSIGINAAEFARPQRAAPPEAAATEHLVFLGNYRHPPNVDAAEFFAEKVMPGLRRYRPEAEFVVLGAHPTAAVEALSEIEGVSVKGFVDDYRPYFWRAAAFVAPLFSGAGMRVKVLEAMACGAPVIGTPLSMHGIGAKDSMHYFKAETAEDFIEAAVRCLEHRQHALDVGERGRQLIEERHDYERKARERELIWHSVIEDWQTHRDHSRAQPPRLEIIK